MNEDFDPRFDAAFQRGYESGVGRSAQVRRTAGEPTGVTEPAAAEPAAAEPRTAEPGTAEPAAAEPAPTAAAEAQPPIHADPFAEPLARRANPFLIALIVLSIALITGGLYLVVKLRDLYAATQGPGAIDYVTIQVLIPTAPIAIGLGVGAGLGVLFLYAARWGRAEG